jgi:uncharacterized protein with NAD-binding domain and iron-sulfur cluster
MAQLKVAILGGGMAGLSAAYQLTKTQALRHQNDVTVYTLGWRLGGKAASGRDSLGRNLEHGLHVWFGCYENTFQMLQELYAARTPPPGSKLQKWQDAVKPQDYTPVGVLKDDGTWTYLPLTWPTNDGTPGDGTLLPTWEQVIEFIIGWLGRWLHRTGQPSPAEAVAAGGPAPAGAQAPAQPASALDAARAHLQALGSRLAGQSAGDLAHLLDLVRWARDAHAGTLGAAAAPDSQAGMIRDILDIFHATLNGIVIDLVLPDQPLESIDDIDFRDWLVKHGADPQIVAKSTVVRVVYDTLYQYVDGDITRPSYAAGTALGVIMRLVGTYKGSMMWDIQAGMGEVIVAPLYAHLLSAGVKFRFFRKVTSIEPAENEQLVQTIQLDRQADTLAGDYTPTISLDGMTCWPAEPLWNQLRDGQKMQAAGVNFESHWCDWPATGQEVLTRGTDFDIVILAISLGAYKPLNDQDGSMCVGLMARNSGFDAFVRNVGIVPTQSVQLWCDPSTAGLGWTTGKAAVVSGPEYLNIWADMTQVIASEAWPDPAPLSLHYLTGTYKTTLYEQPASKTDVPATALGEIRQQAIDWLNESSCAQWPAADAGGAFDWAVLRAPPGTTGVARLDAQFLRANIDPTECCTRSAAGTTRFRLHPDESGFTNLILAGEGTRHGFNTTAIEGAVMSGSAASRAICGQPVTIVGYDFLQRRPTQGPGS